MKGRVAFAAVFGLWTITLTLCVVGVVLVIVGHTSGWPSAVEVLPVAAETLAFTTAGGLIAWRRPRLLAGWLLFAVGFVWMVVAALYAYVEYVSVVEPGITPAARIAAWVANWIWIFAFVAIGLFLLLFPDGRLTGPRWQFVVWGRLRRCVVPLGRACAHAGSFGGVPGGGQPIWHRGWWRPAARR